MDVTQLLWQWGNQGSTRKLPSINLSGQIIILRRFLNLGQTSFCSSQKHSGISY